MNESKQKVLLYSDGSHQALTAAIYTARFLQETPNMQLTILQVKDKDLGPMGVKYSWTELRLKYKKNYQLYSADPYSWIDTWPVSPQAKWLKHIFAVSDPEIMEKQYTEILAKTNHIFSESGRNVQHQTLCLNVSFSEESDRSERVETIIDYAAKNLFNLIVIGTRGFCAFQRMIYGSLSYELLNKSPIPVQLIKKLSQDFIEGYLYT